MNRAQVNSDTPQSSQRIALQYFQMWNTGDSSIADEILSPDWTDHAHPEVTGPRGVRQAVERTRAVQPDLRFQMDTVLGDGDTVAVVGSVGRGARDEPTPRLVWLMHLQEGRLAEMWTYRDTSA